jgi:hypothetical protein
MIQKGMNFDNLFNFNYENKLFKKNLSFKNIFEYHRDLIKDIIIEGGRSLEDFDFYLANLIDVDETNSLINELIENIITNNMKLNVVNLPNIVYQFDQKNFLKFKHLFDLKIFYNNRVFQKDINKSN